MRRKTSSQKREVYTTALIILAITLITCNVPKGAGPTPIGGNLIYTAAAQTVSAQQTLASQSGLATFIPPTGLVPPSATPSNTSPPPTTPPTWTPIPPSPTPIPCDRAKFVEDVSYPDNTEVAPGTLMVKTWRLKNDGSCTWTPGYAVVFTGGEAMGAPAAVPLTGNISPGQTVDVSVTLTAPSSGGTYRGDFKLRNASNVIFGLGDSNKPFYVQIKVTFASGLLYDFLTQAGSANWESGVGSTVDTTLAFGGADGDPNGVAKVKDGATLENGAISGKILLTFPKHQNDGFISGTYPAYTVQNGDRFKARLGFIIPGGPCGVGKVKFQLRYKEGATIQNLADWTETCDGNLLPVDIDLSAIKGKTVQFMLVVKASGTYNEDWAIWSSPRIEHP